MLDSDVYGPSLPTLVNKKNEIAKTSKVSLNIREPIEFEGLKLMSYGFISPNKRAVLRGPIISAITNQLFQVL